MSVWIHPDAEAELAEASEFYARHAGWSIADAFLAEFARALDQLAANPRSSSLGAFGFRLHPFGRFPYTVVYEDDDFLGIRIFAIAHQSRRPGYCVGRT